MNDYDSLTVAEVQLAIQQMKALASAYELTLASVRVHGERGFLGDVVSYIVTMSMLDALHTDLTDTIEEMEVYLAKRTR